MIFAILIAPGVAFELLLVRKQPARQESTFVEGARVLLAGLLIAIVAIGLLGGVNRISEGSFADPGALMTNQTYPKLHFGLIVRSVLVFLFAAACVALIGSELLVRSIGTVASETGWVTAFSRLAQGHKVLLSVELKDGTTITGYRAEFSTETDPAHRELALAPPLTFRTAKADRPVRLPPEWHRLLLTGSNISTVAVSYVERGEIASLRTPRRSVFAWAAQWADAHRWQSAAASLVLVLVAVSAAS